MTAADTPRFAPEAERLIEKYKLSRAAVAKARDDMLAEACLAHCNERTSETATLTD